MKKILPFFCLLFLFAFTAAAQTNENLSCPTVSVRGGGLTRPKETAYFTADVDTKGKTDLQIEYVWTVNNGKIISGQGTPTIGVETPEEGNLTATVEIKGFPEGCDNAVSDTLGCGLRKPEPVKIGEFLNFQTAIEKTQLENLREKLRESPYDQVYIIGRFKKNASEKYLTQKLKKLGGFLMKELTLEAGRITIITAFGDEEFSEIWLVPPGADNPQP